MVQEELTRQADTFARHYRQGNTEVIALDFGPSAGPISVDVVDGTAILVPKEDQAGQFDIDLPDGDVDVTTNNGIVTITIY